MPRGFWRQVALTLLVLASASVAEGTDADSLQAVLTDLGSPQPLASNWTGSDPCASKWLGVTCTASAVTALDLRTPFVTTSLPLSLSRLTGLVSATFQGNTFSGSLPSDWSTLTSLTVLNLQASEAEGCGGTRHTV